MNQLFELLTEYGPIHEVWFDGAHPKRKGGQKYTYNQWYELIRELAPEAVIFGKGPDVRWCGNEAGRTRESEWSVIPINGTPENWTWPDMTDDDLGSLSKIKDCLDNGGFLHWYPAETNTSIRHGWFWRDEAQLVKNVDEILDVWYRSVGGNTVFLLNIPPNNEGLFSGRDVEVLRKVGSKLKNTFSRNLADGAIVTSSAVMDNKFNADFIVDGDLNTCWMPEVSSIPYYFQLVLPEKQKFNRIVMQEKIQEYSQRISEFRIDSKINNEWQRIAKGTTVGYKKVCRTSTVYTDSIKVTILRSRLSPTINNFSLHFEEITISNPVISRDKEGMVSINCTSPGPIIKYTMDGTEPRPSSKTFTQPFKFAKPGIIKALAFDSNLNNSSEIISKKFDIPKLKWKIIEVSSEQSDNGEDGLKAIDGNENTNWISQWRPKSLYHPHFIAIDLGEELILRGFTYTPRKGNVNGTIKNYKFFTSNNGKTWDMIIEDQFDNIKNNPVKQEVLFDSNISARFIKIVALSEINDNPWASAAEIGVITQ